MSWILLAVLLLAVGVITFYQNDYHLKFERMELVYFDKRYVSSANIVTFKYNRTHAVANITVHILIDLGNKVDIQAQAFRFASNEYRLYPIRYMFKYCKACADNDFGLGEFYNCGNFTRCPMKKGNYIICNWATNSSRFPPFIPNGSYKLEIAYMYGATEALTLNLYGSISRPFIY